MANLLSNTAQQTVFFATVARTLIVLVILGTALTLCAAAAFVPAYVTWQGEAEGWRYELTSLEAIDGYNYSTLNKTISDTNRHLRVARVLLGEEGGVVGALRAVGAARPAGAAVQRFEYEADVGGERVSHLNVSVVLPSGASQDNFISALQASGLFTEVDVPIAALVRQDATALSVNLTGIF